MKKEIIIRLAILVLVIILFIFTLQNHLEIKKLIKQQDICLGTLEYTLDQWGLCVDEWNNTLQNYKECKINLINSKK